MELRGREVDADCRMKYSLVSFPASSLLGLRYKPVTVLAGGGNIFFLIIAQSMAQPIATSIETLCVKALEWRDFFHPKYHRHRQHCLTIPTLKVPLDSWSDRPQTLLTKIDAVRP